MQKLANLRAGTRMRACRISLLFTTVLLIIGFTIGCAQNQLNHALQFELEGKNATALILYQQILARTPESNARRAEILTRMGECLYHMDRMQEAYTTFLKAVEADPNNTAARLRMGQMLVEAGAPERAREQANAILQRTPTNTEALALLGAAWAQSGNTEMAKQAYRRVLEQDPKRVKVAIALADIYNHEDDEAKARATLTSAATAAPKNADPWLAMGRLYEQDGNSRLAEEAYRKAVSIDDAPDTNTRLAQFLQRSARIAEAEQTLRKIDSQQARYPVALADFQLLSGRPDEALQQYRRALTAASTAQPKPKRWAFLHGQTSIAKTSEDMNIAARMVEAEIITASRVPPDHKKRAIAAIRSRLQENQARFDQATLNILQAELAMTDDNLALARLFAKAAVEMAPTSAPAHYVAGLVASSSGDDDSAQSEFQNALDQDGHFGPARLALAEDALAHNDAETADEQAREVVRENPGDLQGILIFAKALVRENKPLPAAIMAQRAAALDPTSPEPSLILGHVALKIDNHPQALLNFERALTLRPDCEEAIDGLLSVYQSGQLSYSAIQKMEKTALAPPTSATLLEITGRLYATHGWYNDAIRALKKTVVLDPKRTTAARSLAHLQSVTGDYAGATEAAMKAGVDAQTLLTAYREQSSGDWQKAAATYERALREGDQTGVAANNVAWLYAEHNSQLDRALTLAEAAAHAAPENPAFLDTLGFVHLQRREYSDAVKLLETASRISTELGQQSGNQELGEQIRKHLTQAYLCAGQTRAALKIAQRQNLVVLR